MDPEFLRPIRGSTVGGSSTGGHAAAQLGARADFEGDGTFVDMTLQSGLGSCRSTKAVLPRNSSCRGRWLSKNRIVANRQRFQVFRAAWNRVGLSLL